MAEHIALIDGYQSLKRLLIKHKCILIVVIKLYLINLLNSQFMLKLPGLELRAQEKFISTRVFFGLVFVLLTLATENDKSIH